MNGIGNSVLKSSYLIGNVDLFFAPFPTLTGVHFRCKLLFPVEDAVGPSD